MFFIFLFCVIYFKVVQSENFERNLYDTLFTNYSKSVRPVHRYSDPIEVAIGISLQQLVDVDEKNQIVVVNVWLQLEWDDAYINWDPAQYGGVEDIRLSSSDTALKQIWKPDILLHNSVDKVIDPTYQSNMIVYSSSHVIWIPPGIIRLSCKMDVKWFPFDDQICFFKYGSWTYSKRKLVLKELHDAINKTFDQSEYLENGEWYLYAEANYPSDMFQDLLNFIYNSVERKIEEEDKYFGDQNEPFSVLVFKFKLRRRTLYYGFNMIIPGLLISLITLLGFALPVECGEKITLEISIIPSICVFLQMVNNVTPPTSEAIPLLGIFFTFHMFGVSASVVIQIIVLNLHYRSPATHKMSPTVRYVCLRWLPWLMGLKRPGHSFTRKSLKEEEENENGDESRVQPVYSQYSFYPEDEDSNDNILSGFSSQSNLNLDDRIDYCLKIMMDHPDMVDMGYRAVLTTVQRILQELKFVTNSLRRQDDLEDEKNDWKFLAVVIDRLCLYIFLVFIVGGTCAVLFSAPHLN